MSRRALKPRPRLSLAERLRAHREAFELALELGCTPREAEEELARRAARKRWEESRDRLAAKRNARPERRFADWDTPWMMRD